jgi:hypothetical protein
MKVVGPPLHVTGPALIALMDGRTLLVGGPDTHFQVWTPSTAGWQESGIWPGNATRHLVAQLSGGEVLVLRSESHGWNDSLQEAALWDPSTGQMTTIAPPNAGVDDGSTLTALAGGLALHVGARAPEVWDPGERGWATVARPSSPLRGHIAVRLDDGHVLVAGGDGDEETHVDPTHAVRASVEGLGLLLLVMGAIAAVGVARPSIVVVGLAAFLAGTAALALYVLFTLPRGGG